MLLRLKSPAGKLIDTVDVPLNAKVSDLKKAIEHSSNVDFMYSQSN